MTTKLVPTIDDKVVHDIGPLYIITKIHKFDEQKQRYFVHIERPEQFVSEWNKTVSFAELDVYVLYFDEKFDRNWWLSARNFVYEDWNGIKIYRHIEPSTLFNQNANS
jgi:hypothetical protein